MGFALNGHNFDNINELFSYKNFVPVSRHTIRIIFE